MASERTVLPLRAPALASLRVPSEPTPMNTVAEAHLAWQLASQAGQARQAIDPSVGNPGDEYRSVCEFMRLYMTLRFYQLALLLGTTGSIVTVMSMNAARMTLLHAVFLKSAGLIISLAFLVMEIRATSYVRSLRERGNELASVLGFRAFPSASRWSPLSIGGAGFYLHAVIVAHWLASLFLFTRAGA